MGTNQQDFNNQAFLPYAINGGETTYIPNGSYDSLTNCKDDGYIKPFNTMDVDSNKNHEYENPADVAKRAGLNRAGSGPRRKKNQLYGESKKQKVRLPDTPSSPNGSAECSPLVTTTLPEEHPEKPKSRKCDLKLVIFFILIFCLSAGGLALSLLNMLSKQACPCTARDLPVAPVVNSNRIVETYNDASLIAKLNALQNQYEELKKQMELQKEQLENVNKSATFKPKLLQGRTGRPGPTGAKGPKGDQGPQGIQGIQGPQGVPGIGNVSRCSHKIKTSISSVSENNEKNSQTRTIYDEPQNMRVMAVTCSTSPAKGAGAAFLRTSDVGNGVQRYQCDCLGTSEYGIYRAVKNRNGMRKSECVMHIWECPL